MDVLKKPRARKKLVKEAFVPIARPLYSRTEGHSDSLALRVEAGSRPDYYALPRGGELEPLYFPALFQLPFDATDFQALRDAADHAWSDQQNSLFKRSIECAVLCIVNDRKVSRYSSLRKRLKETMGLCSQLNNLVNDSQSIPELHPSIVPEEALLAHHLKARVRVLALQIELAYLTEACDEMLEKIEPKASASGKDVDLILNALLTDVVRLVGQAGLIDRRGVLVTVSRTVCGIVSKKGLEYIKGPASIRLGNSKREVSHRLAEYSRKTAAGLAKRLRKLRQGSDILSSQDASVPMGVRMNEKKLRDHFHKTGAKLDVSRIWSGGQ